MKSTNKKATRTALVLKNIPRDEWGTNEKGFIAEVYDRVRITKTIRFSTGSLQFTCRTDDGETFVANENMVQPD